MLSHQIECIMKSNGTTGEGEGRGRGGGRGEPQCGFINAGNVDIFKWQVLWPRAYAAINAAIKATETRNETARGGKGRGIVYGGGAGGGQG